MTVPPSVLVFDVNETLIDIDAMTPLFEQIFGDRASLREWFGQLVTVFDDRYAVGMLRRLLHPGPGHARMLGDIHGVDITDEDLDRLEQGMLTMPAHPDVADGLTMLRDNGFRLVTLTNSPPEPDGPTPLEHAGLGGYFERQFSVDTCRTYKPARLSITTCAANFDVPPADA